MTLYNPEYRDEKGNWHPLIDAKGAVPRKRGKFAGYCGIVALMMGVLCAGYAVSSLIFFSLGYVTNAY